MGVEEMITKDDSGPAFPSWIIEGGMSLRDYMAIHAPSSELDIRGGPYRARYLWADAMLEARNK